MPEKKLLAIVLGLILLSMAAVFGLILSLGAFRWKAATRQLLSGLEDGSLSVGPSYYHENDLAELPMPVQRYFRAVLQEGQGMIAGVEARHRGEFNLDEAGEKWVPFTPWQKVTVHRPGFVWDARMRMAPGVKIRVHDAYVRQEGLLRASLFGLITLADLRGTPEIAQGELMRFLAEAAWYPTALLPGKGVRWEAIDEHSARAVLCDGDVSVRAVFHFDANGLIDRVYCEERHRVVKGQSVPTPWQGRFWDYERRDGMLIPLSGEVSWLLPEGEKPYWRGRIMEIKYRWTLQ
ncbi:DUF6920 family protein [Geoalkalibacter halelectricus]|uniref:DUF6920 family protein n=1 Tax=Geoalkalibacter halelectricus TaxID=2847045 RepID=UPI003D1AF6A4